MRRNETHLDPLKSIHDTIVFDSRDWSVNKKDAWLYGIIVGWENEDPIEELGETEDDALNEICSKHGFDKIRLKELRRNFVKIQSKLNQ